MGNLIKMDWYRLRTSMFFIISTLVAFVLNLTASIAIPLLERAFSPQTANAPVALSKIITNPDNFPFILVFMLISLVSFSYSDIANGYIKNIAGQLPNKGYTVISKFIVIALHNFIFVCLVLASGLIGTFITKKVVVDENLFTGILVFFIKWLLTMALTAILLFVSTGLKNKTIASVLGVLLGSGALSLVYMGLNSLFQGNIDVNEFTPDSLFGSLSASSLSLVLNAVIVSAVCIAIFLPLTVKVFKNRDVK